MLPTRGTSEGALQLHGYTLHAFRDRLTSYFHPRAFLLPMKADISWSLLSLELFESRKQTFLNRKDLMGYPI